MGQMLGRQAVPVSQYFWTVMMWTSAEATIMDQMLGHNAVPEVQSGQPILVDHDGATYSKGHKEWIGSSVTEQYLRSCQPMLKDHQGITYSKGR